MGEMAVAIIICGIIMIGLCAYLLSLIYKWEKRKKEKEQEEKNDGK